MSSISTHILDIARGEPAARVGIVLERRRGRTWASVVRSRTDDNGRAQLADNLETGTYRLTFDTGSYLGENAFFPEVMVAFEVRDANQHYHVPLLVSPFGYSTYRGS